MPSGRRETSFNWSVPWLGFNILAMIGSLFLMNYSPWLIWTFSGLCLLTIWGIRYHRSLRPLKKPKFWILFVVITMLTSFLFIRLSGDSAGLREGLMTGIQMNFRAAIMIVGFSTIGTELYNPVIRSFFARTSFRQLPIALEVAFDTLPYAIAKLPAIKDVFKSPVSIVHQLVSHAGFFLEKVTLRFSEKPFIFILSGGIGEGKSSFLKDLVLLLKKKEIRVGGILSPAVDSDHQRIGYDLVNLNTGEREILSRISDRTDLVKVGRFSFFEEGIKFGNRTLSPENNSNSRIVVIDEIGPWELEDQGWAEAVNELLLKGQIPMIWVVREKIIAQVVANWNLSSYKVFNITESSPADAAAFIYERLS